MSLILIFCHDKSEIKKTVLGILIFFSWNLYISTVCQGSRMLRTDAFPHIHKFISSLNMMEEAIDWLIVQCFTPHQQYFRHITAKLDREKKTYNHTYGTFVISGCVSGASLICISMICRGVSCTRSGSSSPSVRFSSCNRRRCSLALVLQMLNAF